MRHKVLQTIQRYQMVQKGDHVVVAFSGGADSSALLTLLWQLREELSITVSACHLNHHLRGEESNRDEAFVRQFCTEHHIELSVREIDAQRLAKEQGKSVVKNAIAFLKRQHRSLGLPPRLQRHTTSMTTRKRCCFTLQEERD